MNLLKKIKSNDNTEIIVKNTVLSGAVKGGSLLISLFTTPAYMHFFNNNEVLGVWFTLLSVLSWILNCDMGIGNGLRNNLVYAIHDKDWYKAKKYISSSYLFMTFIGCIILVIVIIIGRFVSWNRVLNISPDLIPSDTMVLLMAILIGSIIVQFVLRLVTSILYALQEAFIPGLLNLFTNIILLGYVLTANASLKNNNIIALAWVYLIAANLPLVFATIWVFTKKIPNAKPSFRDYRKNYAASILKIGVQFLWLQAIAMVVDNTNDYLISIFINNSAVVEYQVYNRIFYLPVNFMMLLTTSLWSTITKAKAENDWNWLEKSYKKFVLIALLISICELILILPLQFIFNIWLRSKTIQVNYGIAIVFALAGSVMSLRTILSNYSNGLYEIKIQMIFMTLGAIVNIPLAYLFSKLSGQYVSIVVANIISMVPYCVSQMIWCRHYFRNKRIKSYAGASGDQY